MIPNTGYVSIMYDDVSWLTRFVAIGTVPHSLSRQRMTTTFCSAVRWQFQLAGVVVSRWKRGADTLTRQTPDTVTHPTRTAQAPYLRYNTLPQVPCSSLGAGLRQVLYSFVPASYIHSQVPMVITCASEAWKHYYSLCIRYIHVPEYGWVQIHR